MTIVLCSSEVVPFAKTGGLADVCGALPFALAKRGHKVSIFMPHYRRVEDRRFGIKKISDDFSTTVLGQSITVYLVEHKEFYDREGLYGDQHGDYPDNLKRFQFFCWKVLEALKAFAIHPDIVHCHDWQSALIAVYLKCALAQDPFYSGMKSVLTIHNLAYQGVFPKAQYAQLNLDKKLFHPGGLEYYNQINVLKGGIIFSDYVTTVSPQYAKDILTPRLGCGLEGILAGRREGLVGILNGLDYEYWDPQRDEFLACRYSTSDSEKKQKNKEALQERARFPLAKEIPVFGYVGRLAHQKGFDLIAEAMDDLAHFELQIVFLGIGDGKYHTLLKKMCRDYPGKVAAFLEFGEALAHQVYAGADIFLMPSWYEPCGLSQMISLRYGTIPLVFKTGGLADTVVPHEEKDGYGFVFEHYTPQALVKAVQGALQVYKDRKKFQRLIERGAQLRFSWDISAERYEKVFQQCLASG